MKRKIFLLFLALTLLLSGCGGSDTETQNPTVPENGTLTVHFMDVGQGSATLIEQDGAFMLFDGGDGKASSKVVSYLKKNGVRELEYIIASHYDSDHLSGVIGALRVFPTAEVIAPSDASDTKLYRSFEAALEAQDLSVTSPHVGDKYTLGSAEFTILAPKKDYEGDNNDSVAIRLDYGETSFFFGGDAEEESEADMLRSRLPLDVDVYAVSHHGSRSSSSPAFVRALSPTVSVISCGKGNTYGHPHEETLKTLAAVGARIYRTDKEGDIVAKSDGKEISWNMEPYAEASVTPTGEPLIQQNEATYILNTNTKKYHLPTCASVRDMTEKNKKEFFGSKEELEKDGYSPCGRCLK